MLLRHTIGVLIALLAALTGMRARADESTPSGQRPEAKRLRDDGEAAFLRNDLNGALVALRRAYELFPSPNLHYNIALVLDKLGRPAAAVDAYEEFLAAAPTAPAKARAFAAERVAYFEAQVARLALIVSLPDATLTIDGEAVALPRIRDLPVTPGAHRLELTREGYAPLVRALEITAGERRRVVLMPQLIERPALQGAQADAADRAARAAKLTSEAKMLQREPERTATASSRPSPVYKRWWLWTAVGVVAAAGVGVGVGVYYGTRTPPFSGSLPPIHLGLSLR